MCVDDARSIRVMWSDKDGEKSLGLGGLHKLLAQDQEESPPKTKAVPAPKEKGGGRRGGGDPLVGTTAHVPYGGGV